MDPKVVIITRTLNRLEYTILCVRAVHELAGYKNYVHHIVDNGSTDGTREWLRSVKQDRFYNIDYSFMQDNVGDAAGMNIGVGLYPEADYYMQLDNDIEIRTKNFLKMMVTLMTEESFGSIGLVRRGVGQHIWGTKVVARAGVQLINLREVQFLTAAFMVRGELLRKLGYRIDKKILGELPENSGYKLDLNNLKFYRGQGCDECNHIGYKGRVGIYEIFAMNDAINKEILSGKTDEYKIRQIAGESGMINMAQDGLLKAVDGITSIEEVFRVAG